MQRLKTGNFHVGKDLKIYLAFTVLYALFMLSYLFSGRFSAFYDAYFFYFDATYSEFRLWFPRYFFWLFSFMVLVKIAVPCVALYLSYRISKRFLALRKRNVLQPVPAIREFAVRGGKILLFVFIFYLLLYFLLRLSQVSGEQYGDLQMFISRGFLLHLVLQVTYSLFIQRQFIVRYLKNYLLEPQLPFNIALLRIIFFSYLVICYIGQSSAIPTVSLTNKAPLPYIGWLIDLIPVNPQLYYTFIFTGIGACLFIIGGFRTRFFLIVNAICCFYIIAAPNFFGKLWHNQLNIWISWFFMFSRCYDVLSIDALFRKTEIRKSADYTFPIRFVWLQLGIIYFWAGFYKLWDAGFDWALSKSMVNQVQLEWLQHYDKVPAFRIDKYPLLLYIGGLAAILFELSYILFVVRKKWRWIAALGGLAMHNLIGYFLYIHFVFLQFLYIFYIDFNYFFKKKHAENTSKPAVRYSRLALYAGIFILSMNFVCGMFNVDTYPFSSYPKYSAMIPDNIKTIHFQCDDPKIDFHKVGKKNHFRWEDYGWLEYSLIEDFEAGKDIKQRLADYYEIWVRYNPGLKSCGPVKVYIKQRPVSPEGKDSLKTIRYICMLSFQK